jgi:hypothetical protein
MKNSRITNYDLSKVTPAIVERTASLEAPIALQTQRLVVSSDKDFQDCCRRPKFDQLNPQVPIEY